jgi:hypothetical protein
MSLFDNLFSYKKISEQEDKILDKCFNSISQYTQQNYDFENKVVGSNLKKDNLVPNLYCHEVVYTHRNTNDSDDFFNINCRKYVINNKTDLDHIKSCFEDNNEDRARKINVPNINHFPKNILQVGWHGLGFITILNYDSRGIITSDCENSIKKNSIKFLQNSHLGENKNITFK